MATFDLMDKLNRIQALGKAIPALNALATTERNQADLKAWREKQLKAHGCETPAQDEGDMVVLGDITITQPPAKVEPPEPARAVTTPAATSPAATQTEPAASSSGWLGKAITAGALVASGAGAAVGVPMAVSAAVDWLTPEAKVITQPAAERGAIGIELGEPE